MKKIIARHKVKLGVIFFVGVFVIAFLLKSTGHVPDFSMIKEYRMSIEAFLAQNLFLGIVLYAGAYIATVALSLPFATPLTVLAGFLFGNFLGTGMVVIAASLGATLALVLVRFFFYEYVKNAFGYRLHGVHKEMQGNGFRDILILRLTPIVPFSLINLGAALTPVKVSHFFLATILGTIPFTFIYVNAGTQLATLASPADILSGKFILGVSLIVFAATLPLFIRRRYQ